MNNQDMELYGTEMKKIIDFFEQNIQKLNWDHISKNHLFPLDFYLKHFDKIKWSSFCKNTTIPLYVFEENISKIKWSFLCGNNSIPVEFFKQHPDKIRRIPLLGNESIPVEFLLELSKDENWIGLYGNKNVKLSFFEENIQKVEWKYFWYREHIPEYFLEKHLDKIDWLALLLNKTVHINFFKKHVNKIKLHEITKKYLFLLGRSDIGLLLFIDEHFDTLFSQLTDKKKYNFVKYFINQRIKCKKFGNKFHKHTYKEGSFVCDFYCKSSNVDLKLIEENLHDVSKDGWSILSSNSSVPIDFLIKHKDKIDFLQLSRNDFSIYLKNIKRLKMQPCLNEIKNSVYYAPPGSYKAIPNGGDGFWDVMEKYE